MMIIPNMAKPILYGWASNMYPLTPMTIPSKKNTALVQPGLNNMMKYAIAIKISIIAVAMTSFVIGWCLKNGEIAQTINIKANITPNNLNILTFAIITLNFYFIFIVFISFYIN